MDHKQYLPKDQPYKDLVHLIQFLLRQFFKAVEDDPFIIVHVSTCNLRLMVVLSYWLIVSNGSGAVSEEPWPLETVLELEARREIHREGEKSCCGSPGYSRLHLD